MKKATLKESFIRYCEINKFEKNKKQIEIIDLLSNFVKPQKKLINLFIKSKEKLCFYLYGNVGLGKTMILDYFYEFIKVPKFRVHFNEFMISFHDFRHKNKSNSIKDFVKKIKKYELIYLDELQVTNIVDAMILGKLFETIFAQNIKILITSNIKIDDLYKDGLQRDQFLPFISILKKNSVHKRLIVGKDYRKSNSKFLKRVFSPLNEKNRFKFNQMFRELTKNLKKTENILNIKGRNFIITEFYQGVARFKFNQLCDANLGAEDYIKICDICKFIAIENIPVFSESNANQQQRFITLVDILYEKKIFLMITIEKSVEKMGSSKLLLIPFKRTLSRLLELTSKNPKI